NHLTFTPNAGSHIGAGEEGGDVSLKAQTLDRVYTDAAAKSPLDGTASVALAIEVGRGSTKAILRLQDDAAAPGAASPALRVGGSLAVEAASGKGTVDGARLGIGLLKKSDNGLNATAL